MAKDLLLEIGLEEIPAKYVTPSSQQLVKRVSDFLTENKLTFGEIVPFSTPRRLAVIVKSVADKQEDTAEIVKGPAKKLLLMLKEIGAKRHKVLFVVKEQRLRISRLKKLKVWSMFTLISLPLENQQWIF